MSSSNYTPPIFPDEEKFDGTNFFGFKTRILIATRVRGALGYLEGIIKKPSPLPTGALPPEPTDWTSTSPSVEEWGVRDAWVLALITYNTKNPVGLGVKIDGTAAEAWESLTDTYGTTSELAAVHAEKVLRNTTFSDDTDFLEHIATLRMRWTAATEKGATIDDRTFRGIIIASLPESWNEVVSTLYGTKNSAELIAGLTLHWERLRLLSVSPICLRRKK
ncbi:hypothetical protein LshimejAT787_2400230 [Lyophyllum shimeji]|uniref:Uncharacterized protein n=1 Tax=Lyophyllum shimeji TaxID=47721 RepID=A0A9P3UV70_LYOSH|nr:hypothetical protein LshimejAT787_2400230 [Lyophyllum shimeji]